jgi:hypothetical protein
MKMDKISTFDANTRLLVHAYQFIKQKIKR